MSPIPIHSTERRLPDFIRLAKAAWQSDEDGRVFEEIMKAKVPTGSIYTRREEFVCRVFRPDMPITMEFLKNWEKQI